MNLKNTSITQFNETKIKFKKVFKEILQYNEFNKSVSESALPAYTHDNPLIDFLFWKRLLVCYNYTINSIRGRNILDFGCGTGIFSYLIALNGFEVIAVDLDFKTLNLVREKVLFPENVSFIEGDILKVDSLTNKFDIIVALDCLEHIKDIDSFLLKFKSLLKGNGCILVCGPTENLLYKIGRKIAGPEFTGQYHFNNIREIKQKFAVHFKVKTISRLFFPFVFFEIFVAKNEI